MVNRILHELEEHSPFTALACLTGVIFVYAVNFFFSSVNAELFDFFHPAHILFASLVSAAIFYKYQKNFMEALLIGSFISIIMGSISDIIFPYFGSIALGIPISFHLPAIETPVLIFSCSFAGAFIGILLKRTKFPHFIHVFLSMFASFFYIYAFGIGSGMVFLFLSFIIVFVSVVIPCCLSDIVLPLLFHRKNKNL